MDRNSLAKDGGYASRKFWFALVSSILVLIASRIAPIAALGEVIGGLVMICGVYITGNTVVRWKQGSVEQTKVMQSQAVQEPPKENVQVKPEDDLRG